MSKSEFREKCRCSMSIAVLGDGCMYCNPDEYIQMLHDRISELEAELDDKIYEQYSAKSGDTSGQNS